MANEVQPPCADCSTVVAALNEATGKRYDVTSMVVGRLTHQRHKENGVPACLSVITDRVAAWQRDPKMREYLRPATLFAKLNFAKYWDEIRATSRPPEFGPVPTEAGAYRRAYVAPPRESVVRPVLTAYPSLTSAFSAIAARENWPEHHRAKNWAVLSGFPPAEIDIWLASHGCRLEALQGPPAGDPAAAPMQGHEDEFPPI